MITISDSFPPVCNRPAGLNASLHKAGRAFLLLPTVAATPFEARSLHFCAQLAQFHHPERNFKG